MKRSLLLKSDEPVEPDPGSIVLDQQPVCSSACPLVRSSARQLSPGSQDRPGNCQSKDDIDPVNQPQDD